jgi:DNA-binding LytR/AlgR family response regulator
MNSDQINVLVVEDQAIVAEDIATKLRRHGMHVSAICSSAEEAIDSALSNSPDIILMDIQLKGKMDGITAASVIRRSQDVPVVYLSDLRDTATVERAKKTFPESYLTKPFVEEDLVRAIEFACHNHNNRQVRGKTTVDDAVFLRTESQTFIKVLMRDILYLEADRAYCKVVCREKVYILSSSMNHIFEQIESDHFIRVHRSYIINIACITEFEGNVVKIGDKEITMNRESKEVLIARLKFVK